MNSCFIYACEQRVLNGGKLRWVKSKRGNWHHFYWESPSGKKYEYTNSSFYREGGPSVPLWRQLYYYGKVREYEHITHTD
jgi:hypothetical protein